MTPSTTHQPSFQPSSPLSEVDELALFERICARLIANPERLKVVIRKAGITDNLGRLTRRYGGS
jgi:hypothetical protein